MAAFNDLGLREPLLAALEEAGIERPTALQAAAIPVLRREGNLVARAGSGSGKTLAYGLGILDRLEARAPAEAEGGEDEEGGETPAAESGGTRLLVLRATPELAERTALELVPFAQVAGLGVVASGRGWGTPAGEADVLVATPTEVMEAVRTSGVKLEALEAVVVDGASDIESLGGWDAVEMLFDHVPRAAQRVVVSTELTAGVQDMVDRRVKRAHRLPSEAAMADQVEVPEVTGVVGYVLVSERDKIDTVARLLGGERGDDAAPLLVCRTDERAADVAEALALRGFLVGEMDDADADVAIASSATPDDLAEETGEHPTTVISYDVPADEATLRALHGGEITGFVLLLPRELPHLRQIARRAGLEPRPAGITGEEPAAQGEVRAFRTALRRAVREEDLGAQMLVLEPLLEDYTAAEIAAAACALLRKRAPLPVAAEAATPVPSRPISVPAGPSAPRERPARSATGAPPAFTRLFVGVGERDGVRPGDLVGAIAGETDIPGSSVGKIDIRDTFSIVEVPADVADRVISAVNGITVKGRSVRVDYDRGATRGPRRADRPGGGPGGRGPGGPGGPRGGAGPRGPGARGPGGPGGRGKFAPRDRDGAPRRPARPRPRDE